MQTYAGNAMIVRSLKDIKEGQEITVAYVPVSLFICHFTIA